METYFTYQGLIIFAQFFKILNTVLRIVLFLELHQSIFGWASEKWGQWLALPMQCQVIVKGPREGQFLPFAKNVRRGLLAAVTATLDWNPSWRSILIIFAIFFSLTALKLATSRSIRGKPTSQSVGSIWELCGIMNNVCSRLEWRTLSALSCDNMYSQTNSLLLVRW